ncbi:MAG TPA: hypothetical protein VI876_07725 [Dehalococcoidia bacterium]|nr:hypothetical protein [Dehalococcoidia bacterium]
MNGMAESKNMRLLSHNNLNGFGNGGEGLALQQTRDGRRVLYIAHESAPKNFTVVDVSDPTEAVVIAQTDLPHEKVRSNSLDVVGDILAVAYQTSEPGLKPAGLELFDVSDPAAPRSIAFLDRSGPNSRGAHCLWFVDGEYIHMSSGAPDSTPANRLDDQFYQIIDVRDPSKPREVGRWWLPGTQEGDGEPPPERHETFDMGFRTHNINVYPERPDRAYVGYIDGGAIILDIADKSRPRLISRLDYHPPMSGFTHTVLPLLSKETLIVSDEAIQPGGKDWPKPVWVVDVRDETRPMITGTLPLPPVGEFAGRGGRFGAHNLHENHPLPTALRSDDLVYGAYFNAGVRVHDVSNPWSPKEVGYYIPAAPEGSRFDAAQMNDVYVDENGLVYAIERFTGGLYVLEGTF